MNDIIIHPYFEYKIAEELLIIKNNLISNQILKNKSVNNVSHVVFGQGVDEIPGRLFFKNTKLENIYLSNSIKSIGIHAFSDCPNLKGIYVDELNFDLLLLNIAFNNNHLVTIYTKENNTKDIIEKYIFNNKLDNFIVK